MNQSAMASSAVVWHHPQTGELNSINSMTDGSGSIVASSSLLPNQSLFNNNSSSNSTITNKGLNIETESTLSGYNNDNRPKKNGRNGTAAYAAILSNNSANTSPGAIMLAQSPMANNIINPYHGNYQANNNGAGQVHSIVSMRTANSRHSQSSRNNGQVPKSIESPYIIDKNNRHEIVQVSMLTEDDNWQDNTTAITGNTSDQSGSIDDLTKLDKVNLIEIGNEQMQIRCQMWSTTIITLVLSICAFCSPIIMVILPRIDWFEWKTKECGPECDGLVISFVFKLFILAFGSWAVFFRRPKATMPRICMFRAAILALIVIFMISYWLFYSVRIAEKRFSEEDAISYYSIILFAISLVDALLFIHYLAVLLLYFRNMDTQYFVKVVRSPDGHSQCYSLGRTSIQRASVWILEKYYQDFPRYNPFAERIYLKKLHRNNVRHGLKYYDVDGVIGSPNNKPEKEKLNSIVMNPMQLSPKSILAQNTAANAGRPKEVFLNGGSRVSDGRGNRHRNLETASHHSGHSAHRHHRHHSDRFHEEHEYERRVRKRKSRLISVTEEAFTHIKRVQQTRNGPSVPMDPKEAAQAIFPTIAKTLQKYLRITRQQTRHSVQSILEHLSVCLTYDLSPKAFLEKYFSNRPVLASPGQTDQTAKQPIQTWSLICDTLVSRSIKSGTMFLLRQGDISLLVTVHRMAHLNLNEVVLDSDNTKFIFKLNSETSV